MTTEENDEIEKYMKIIQDKKNKRIEDTYNNIINDFEKFIYNKDLGYA